MNEYEPVLVMKQCMLRNPLTYRKYLDIVEEKEETNFKRKKSELGKPKKRQSVIHATLKLFI